MPPTIVVHWTHFGPYHLARLRATHRYLQNVGVRLVGLETASEDATYGWRVDSQSTHFARLVVFPHRAYQQISLVEMWSGMFSALNQLQPHVLAIAGYRLPDAWSLLAWCHFHRCPAILMSDSKYDDYSRSWWKEWIKRRVLGQFAAALCAGQPHKMYLEQLGLRPDLISTGYDVVDNDYFWQGAERARQRPATIRHLPGLESDQPFFLASARFIPRKNLDGLLRAYACYRHQLRVNGAGDEPWRLVVLGDGPERERLHQLAKTLNICGVVWPGFRQIEELAAYYGLAGAFIHPARQEQWGLVVNEAMAAGSPVLVSSTCGCVPDLVIEGRTGFTFNPDDPQQLANLMVRFSRGQVERAELGEAARAHISHWGPARFAEGLYGALQVALGKC